MLQEDTTFKSVFAHPEILEYLINAFLEYLGLDLKFLSTSIEVDSFMLPDNKEIKGFKGDIKANLDNGDLINIEMYQHNFTKEMYNKSYAYMCRLFSSQIKKNKRNSKDIKNYKDMKRVISLNFISGNYKKENKELVNCYLMKNSLTNKVIDDGNLIMYLIRVDKVKEIVYNKNEKKFITILRMMNARDIKEMEQFRKDNKIMDEIIKYVKEWNEELDKDRGNTLKEWIEETIQDGIEEGVEKELKKELAKKTKKEIEKNTLNIAKKMLIKNVAIDEIADITGLSKKQVLALK